jgi:hypothetical protein
VSLSQQWNVSHKPGDPATKARPEVDPDRETAGAVF